MAGSEVHIIRKQTFKLKLAKGKDPLALEKRIQEIFRKKVTHQLADIFSSLGPPDLVIRIDKLVINVGVIKADTLGDFEREFTSRIHHQVKSIIQKILTQKDVPGISMKRNLSEEEEELELLAIFLKTGRLPWWTPMHPHTLDKLLGNLLKKQPGPLLELISKQIRHQPQLRRLVRQFPQRELVNLLLSKLTETEWEALSPYLIESPSSRKSDKSFVFVTSERLQNWERVVKYLFTSLQPFNQQKLLKEMVMPSLQRNKPQAPLESPQKSKGEDIISTQQQQDTDNTFPTSAPAIREVLIHFLVHGSLPKQFNNLIGEQLETYFLELGKDSPQQLFEVIEDIIDHPFAVNRLLYQFSPELIITIIATLSEQPIKFWTSTLKLIQKGLPTQLNGQSAQRYVERFALAYGVKVYRESFDSQVFIHDFLTLLKKKESIELKPLLKSWEEKKIPAWFQKAVDDFRQTGRAKKEDVKSIEEMIEECIDYLQENTTSQPGPPLSLATLVEKAPMRLVESLKESILTPQMLHQLVISLPPRKLLIVIEKSAPVLQGKVENILEILISFLANQKTSPPSDKVKKWLLQVFLVGALHRTPQRSVEGWSLLLLRSLADFLKIPQDELVSSFQSWLDDRSIQTPRMLRLWMATADLLEIEHISQEEGEEILNELPFELIQGELEELDQLGEIEGGEGRIKAIVPDEVSERDEAEKRKPLRKDASITEIELSRQDEITEREALEGFNKTARLSDLKSSKPGHQADQELVRELLTELLRKGRLEKTRKKPEAIFKELFDRDLGICREVLSSFIENPMIRARVLSWLDASDWEKLESVLPSEMKNETPRLIKDIVLLLNTELVNKREKKPPVIRKADLPKLEKLIHEAKLIFILDKSPKTLGRLLERIIAMWASNIGLRHADFLFELRKATEAQRQNVSTNLPILLGKMAKRNRKHRLPKPAEERRKKRNKEVQTDPMLEGVTVLNGGAVILAPFLPRYFQILGLRQEGAFVDDDAHERAIHLLQYLITGQSESGEHELMLNKVLCGFPLEKPIGRGIKLKENEKAISEQLLNGVIQNWTTIKRSSIEALRETFLQREGILAEKDEMWMLKIEQGPFDMILDTLPWSISMVKLSWMEKILQVEWR